MPEERNRVLTDHLATLLLCPSELAAANLSREAIGERAVVVSNVMVDLAIGAQARARAAGAAANAACGQVGTCS